MGGVIVLLILASFLPEPTEGVLLTIYNLRNGLICVTLLVIGLIIYSIFDQNRKATEIESHLEELTTDVNSATKNNLINSTIPLVLVETDGNIMWKSRTFVTEFNNTDINTSLIPILKEIKMDIEKSDASKIYNKEIH